MYHTITLTPLYTLGIVPTQVYPKYKCTPSKVYAMRHNGTYTTLPYNFVRTYRTSYKAVQAKHNAVPTPVYITPKNRLHLYL